MTSTLAIKQRTTGRRPGLLLAVILSIVGCLLQAGWSLIWAFPRINLNGWIITSTSHRSRLDMTDVVISSQLLVDRFDLAGVISSSERVYRYHRVPRQVLPEPLVIEEQVVVDVVPPELRILEGIRQQASRLYTYLEPVISATVAYDEITRNGETESSLMTSVSPQMRADVKVRRWNLKASYDIDHQRSFGNDEASETNHNVTVSYAGKMPYINSRRLRTSAEYRHWENRKRQLVIEDYNTELVDDFVIDSLSLSSYYKKGTDRSRSQWQTGVAARQIHFDDRGAIDDSYRLRQLQVNSKWAWKWRPRLALLLDGSVQRQSYTGRTDSDTLKTGIGGDWRIAPKTRARFTAGYARRDDDAFGSRDTYAYAYAVNWSPRRHISFELEGQRRFFDWFSRTDGRSVGEAGVEEYISLNWRQNWNRRLNSHVGVTMRERSYNSPRGNGDETLQVLVGADYSFSPRLSVSLDGTHTRAVGALEYDRNTVQLNANMRL